MRKLLIIPIFHTDVDMGSFKEKINEITEKQFGKVELQNHRRDIVKFWEELDKIIEKRIKDIDISVLRIYQDGHAVGGPIGIKIAKEIAERGSRNHQIIMRLINRGAVLMKTESIDLLKEEYFLIKSMVMAKTPVDGERAAMEYRKRKDEILKKRDKHIAENIDKTLKEDETSILFIGAAHNVEKELPSDIVVDYLEK